MVFTFYMFPKTPKILISWFAKWYYCTSRSFTSYSLSPHSTQPSNFITHPCKRLEKKNWFPQKFSCITFALTLFSFGINMNMKGKYLPIPMQFEMSKSFPMIHVESSYVNMVLYLVYIFALRYPFDNWIILSSICTYLFNTNCYHSRKLL